MATETANAPIKIIDADTHLTEPHDMWTKRAPAKFRDRVLQVKMHEGIRSWIIDGDKSIGTGAHPNSAVLKEGGKIRDLDRFLKVQFEEVHLGASSVKERLAVMEMRDVLWSDWGNPERILSGLENFGKRQTAAQDPLPFHYVG